MSSAGRVETANEQFIIEIQPSVSRTDTATKLQVLCNSPTNPHLRAFQWQTRRKLPQRPESCSLQQNDHAKSERTVIRIAQVRIIV